MRREIKYGSLLTINIHEVERKSTKKSLDKCSGACTGDPAPLFFYFAFSILSKETRPFIYLILLFPPVDIPLNEESVIFIWEDLPSDDALQV